MLTVGSLGLDRKLRACCWWQAGWGVRGDALLLQGGGLGLLVVVVLVFVLVGAAACVNEVV